MTKRQTYILYKFIQYIVKEFGITDPYKFKTGTNKEEFKTFAHYDPNNGLIAVYVTGRALGDIMRSVAHEFWHHKQNQTGELKSAMANGGIQDVGGKIEDDANSKAGQMIKKFGYAYPDLKIWNTD